MAMEPKDSPRSPTAQTVAPESFVALAEAIDEPYLVFDAHQHVAYANQAAIWFTGYPAEELHGLHRSALLQESESDLAQSADDRRGSVIVVVHRDGMLREVACRIVPNGPYTGVLLMPMPGELAHGGSLARYVRALRTLSECARVVVRAGTEMELLREICRTLVEVGGYRFSWIGYMESDGLVNPVAQRGFREGFLASHQVSWLENSPTGHGVIGACIRSRKPAILRNVLTEDRYRPWWQLAREYGFSAVLGVPLIVENEPIGAIAFYAADSGAFGDEETGLLEEVARDLSFGIAARRLRKVNRRTLRALERTVTELQYQKQALDLHAIVCVVGPDGLVEHANRKACLALGVEPRALEGRDYRSFIAPEAHPPEFLDALRKCLEAGEVWQGELAIASPERGVRWMETTVVPFLDPAGRIDRFVMLATDITSLRQ